jgi:hypothetical protein
MEETLVNDLSKEEIEAEIAYRVHKLLQPKDLKDITMEHVGIQVSNWYRMHVGHLVHVQYFSMVKVNGPVFNLICRSCATDYEVFIGIEEKS